MSNRLTISANQVYYARRPEEHAYELDQRPRIRARLRSMVERLLQNSCPTPLRVLDVGTGSGLGLQVVHAVAKSSQLVGCDVSADLLRIARPNLTSAAFILVDGLRLPFPDRSFNLVMFISVLHHLYDPQPLLADAIRVLGSNGTIIIVQEPNPTVNAVLLRLRRWSRLLPDDDVQTAEYHQFMTSGLRPRCMTEYLEKQGLTCELEFSNEALLDEVALKAGGFAAALLSPLALMHNRFTCLSYSIIASRVRG